MKLKAADKKAKAPQHNENKVKDFLRYVCKLFQDHELCPLTYELMQQEVISRDFRNRKAVHVPFTFCGWNLKHL